MVGRVYFDEDAFYTKLGKELRDIRDKRRMTQEELARAAGLERTSIANIERGKQKTPLHILYKLCSALRVEIYTLLPKVADTVVTIAKTTSIDAIDIGNSPQYVPSSVAHAVRHLVDDVE